MTLIIFCIELLHYLHSLVLFFLVTIILPNSTYIIIILLIYIPFFFTIIAVVPYLRVSVPRMVAAPCRWR